MTVLFISHHVFVYVTLLGAYEGLASAAIVSLRRRDVSELPVQRNLSFSLHRGLSAVTSTSLNSTSLRSELLVAITSKSIVLA